MIRRAISALAFLAASALACSLPGGQATPTSAPPVEPTPTPVDLAPTQTEAEAPPTQPPPSPTPLHSDWPLYTDPDYGFQFRYPPGGTVDGPIAGQGRIDLPFAQGTSLSEKYLQVDARPQSPCETPLVAGYAPGSIPIGLLTIGGKEFGAQEGSEGAAGSLYEWFAYSIPDGPNCISLSFVLRSTNPGVYDNPPAEFDQLVETAVFEEIVTTYEWLP